MREATTHSRNTFSSPTVPALAPKILAFTLERGGCRFPHPPPLIALLLPLAAAPYQLPPPPLPSLRPVPGLPDPAVPGLLPPPADPALEPTPATARCAKAVLNGSSAPASFMLAP